MWNMFKVNVFIVNFEYISNIVLVSLLLTLNNFTPCSSIFVINFEHVIASWNKNGLELQKDAIDFQNSWS